MLRVAGRPFYVKVSAYRNKTGYSCHFHEKHEFFGRTWGYVASNKNFATKERDEVYDWFKTMVENNTPGNESGEQVLEGVISQLEDEFEQVERES